METLKDVAKLLIMCLTMGAVNFRPKPKGTILREVSSLHYGRAGASRTYYYNMEEDESWWK